MLQCLEGFPQGGLDISHSGTPVLGMHSKSSIGDHNPYWWPSLYCGYSYSLITASTVRISRRSNERKRAQRKRAKSKKLHTCVSLAEESTQESTHRDSRSIGCTKHMYIRVSLWMCQQGPGDTIASSSTPVVTSTRIHTSCKIPRPRAWAHVFHTGQVSV